MAPHPDYPRTRLFVSQPLAQNALITLGDKQAHYLLHVLRYTVGTAVALFNGCDGEWLAVIDSAHKKSAQLSVQKQLRPFTKPSDIWLIFAPLKNAKTEWIIEKGTELGVVQFCPVSTQFTMVDKLNESRLEAIAVEASEQCERLDVPTLKPLLSLTKLLETWPAGRHLIYGDESGNSENAKEILPALTHSSYAVLIGPEGGFSATELDLLRSLPYANGMCMGPRVMRADTAAIAALSLVQAWCGDWQAKPAFRHS